MIKAADKKTTTAKQNKTTNKRTTHLLFTSISFDFIYVFLFLCRLMFETNHMWLVKSLVRKTNIIKLERNSDNTQK